MKGLRAMAGVYAVVPCFFMVRPACACPLTLAAFYCFFYFAMLPQALPFDRPKGDGMNTPAMPRFLSGVLPAG